MDRCEELEVKHARLAALMSRLKLDAVLLRTRASFAWITGGGRSAVNACAECGVASVLVTERKLHIITNNIEAERIVEEEVDASIRGRFTVASCNWFEPGLQGELLRKLVGDRACGVDLGEGGLNVSGAIATLRMSLTEAELRRYVSDGPALAATLEAVARQVRRGMSEREIGAMIHRVLGEIGFRAAVCLVGADERMDRRRHPLPTEAEVRGRVMLVAVAERSGLYCAATRIVCLDEPDGAMRRRMRATAEVMATAIAASEPGRPYAEALEAIVGEYARQGYEHEWRWHHQGGPIGYQARELIVTPGSVGEVLEGQALAWNPTMTGVKCEDTVLTRAGGRMLLCGPGEGWPAFEIERGGRAMRCADMLTVGGG